MIDLSHVAQSPATLLMAALAGICIARVLFRMAFRVLIILAVIGAGAIGIGSVQPPAGINPQTIVQDVTDSLSTAMQQATGIAANLKR